MVGTVFDPHLLATDLLASSDEALVITVGRVGGERKLSVHHKVINNGVLNHHLAGILAELLARTDGKDNHPAATTAEIPT